MRRCTYHVLLLTLSMKCSLVAHHLSLTSAWHAWKISNGCSSFIPAKCCLQHNCMTRCHYSIRHARAVLAGHPNHVVSCSEIPALYIICQLNMPITHGWATKCILPSCVLLLLSSNSLSRVLATITISWRVIILCGALSASSWMACGRYTYDPYEANGYGPCFFIW